MTDAEATAPARRRRRLPVALVVVGVVVMVLALLLVAARRIVAREALLVWLRSKGVDASAQVHSLGLRDLSGAVRLGDPQRPDFTAERVEVGYRLRGLRLEIGSVGLVRPVLRAQLHDGRLSAGSLDPLIESLRKRPPTPGAPQPHVQIEDGRLLLTTDAGPVGVLADAAMDQGKLVFLSARTDAMRLQQGGRELVLGPGALNLRARGERVALAFDAPAPRVAAGDMVLENARITLVGAAPYPDLTARRIAGPLEARAEFAARRAAMGARALNAAVVSLNFTGQASGGIKDLRIAGRTAGTLRAAAADPGVRDLRFSQLTADMAGPVAYDPNGPTLDLTAHAVGRGAWTGLGAPRPGDSREIAAVRRAARAFAFTAEGRSIGGAAGKVRVGLTAPARLRPDIGGEALLVTRGSGYRLTVAGGGLPRVDAQIRRAGFQSGAAVAQGRIQAALSLGPVRDGVVDAEGRLRLADGVISFTGERCAQIRAARLDMGEKGPERPAGRLCPTGGPLLTMKGGDWRIFGRAEDWSTDLPMLQARVAHAFGTVDLGQVGGDLRARVAIDRAVASDALDKPRYYPLTLSGQARASGGLWRASFAARDRAERALGRAELRHEAVSGRGRVDVDTETLRFAEGGLQPADLSPLAAAVGSPAVGEAHFTGWVAWTKDGATSGGVLETPGLDFTSPAGRVAGLSGRVVLASLAPLTAAPGQTLHARSIASPMGQLTDATAVFALTPDALRVDRAEAQTSGGSVKAVNVEAPLKPGAPVRGVVELEGVQLQDLVRSSPFGDRVSLVARVSGRIPFEMEEGKVRVTGGSLHAIEPGRLSIQRTALMAVTASGEVTATGGPAAAAEAAAAAAPNAFTDFAYQAMEHLAFSTLSADVETRPDGRLGVLFRIIGKHDPPKRQEIRLSIFDLVDRKFLNRPLPLPSGTGVNLTLDTTLNLDDLLSDYAEVQRLRSSATVQPSDATR